MTFEHKFRAKAVLDRLNEIEEAFKEDAQYVLDEAETHLRENHRTSVLRRRLSEETIEIILKRWAFGRNSLNRIHNLKLKCTEALGDNLGFGEVFLDDYEYRLIATDEIFHLLDARLETFLLTYPEREPWFN